MNVSEGLDVTFVSIGGNMVMVMMMMVMLERRWDDASVSIRRGVGSRQGSSRFVHFLRVHYFVCRRGTNSLPSIQYECHHLILNYFDIDSHDEIMYRKIGILNQFWVK